MSGLTLHSATGTTEATTRRATRHGRDHLVVPVVAALGDSVVSPLGARPGRSREFIPATALANAARSWNGRPVVMDHPKHEGAPLSALDPTIDDQFTYGTVYNARYEDGRLRADLWLDLERAPAVGATPIIDAINGGGTVEVSVGALVLTSETPGTSPTGVSYDYAWVVADGDHIATLPPGVAGACSVSMGCGAPRVYQGADMPNDQPTLDTHGRKLTPWQRLRRMFNDMAELHTAFKDDIEKADPVDDDNPQSTTVTPVDAPPTLVANTATEVTVTPVATVTGGDDRQGDPMCQIDDLAGRLIANERAPFKEEQRANLTAMGADTLTSLLSLYESNPSPGPTSPSGPSTPSGPSAPSNPGGDNPSPSPGPQNPPTPSPAVLSAFSEADVLAQFPEIRAAVDAHKAHIAGLTNQLVNAITPACNGAFTEAQLRAKPIAELQALGRALRIDEPVDHSLRGLAAYPQVSDERDIPDSYGLNKVQ